MAAFSTITRLALAGAALASLNGCASLTGGELVSGNAPVAEIAILNNMRDPINAVTISRCSAMSHGLNRLSGEIAPGQGMRWRLDQGCWDIQAAYGYGTGYNIARFNGIQIQGNRRYRFRVDGPNGGPIQQY